MLLSPLAEERGGGVGILYRHPLIVTPLFQDLHTRNLTLARVSSISSKPVLLLAVYIPPDDRRREALSHLSRVLEFLHERYSTFSLLGFGDLNIDFVKSPRSTEAKRLTSIFSRYKIKLHIYSNNIEPTRKQANKVSHIDYYFTTGLELGEISIGDRFGCSDHFLVSCKIMNAQPIRRKRQVLFSKRRAAAFLKEVVDGESFRELLKLTPLKFFRTLSGRLSDYAITFLPRPRSFFRVIDSVEKELQKSGVNWGKVVKMILSCRGTEYMQLMNRLNELRSTCQLKEYHCIVGSILKVRKKAFVVNEIEDTAIPGELIFDPARIRTIIAEKHRQL